MNFDDLLFMSYKRNLFIFRNLMNQMNHTNPQKPNTISTGPLKTILQKTILDTKNHVTETIPKDLTTSTFPTVVSKKSPTTSMETTDTLLTFHTKEKLNSPSLTNPTNHMERNKYISTN